ncbi:hypothetical protein B0H11DRAFT_955451 [Mycena galericulata]|nr:hypothetical protein B0H11DRAFT_955451 [Mycena galericulata]
MSIAASLISHGKAPPLMALLISGFHVASLVVSNHMKPPDSVSMPSSAIQITLEPSKTFHSAVDTPISTTLLVSAVLAFVGVTFGYLTLSKTFFGASSSHGNNGGGDDGSNGDDPPEPGDGSSNTDGNGNGTDSDNTGRTSNGEEPPPPPPPSVNVACGKPKRHWLINFFIWLLRLANWLLRKVFWWFILPLGLTKLVFHFRDDIMAFLCNEKIVHAARVVGDRVVAPLVKRFLPVCWAYYLQARDIFDELCAKLDVLRALINNPWLKVVMGAGHVYSMMSMYHSIFNILSLPFRLATWCGARFRERLARPPTSFFGGLVFCISLLWWGCMCLGCYGVYAYIFPRIPLPYLEVGVTLLVPPMASWERVEREMFASCVMGVYIGVQRWLKPRLAAYFRRL